MPLTSWTMISCVSMLACNDQPFKKFKTLFQAWTRKKSSPYFPNKNYNKMVKLKLYPGEARSLLSSTESVHCLYSSVTQTLCKKSRTTHKPVGIEIIRSFEMQSCLPTFDCPEHRRWLRDPESERLRVREILSMRLNMMLTICGYRD